MGIEQVKQFHYLRMIIQDNGRQDVGLNERINKIRKMFNVLNIHFLINKEVGNRTKLTVLSMSYSVQYLRMDANEGSTCSFSPRVKGGDNKRLNNNLTGKRRDGDKINAGMYGRMAAKKTQTGKAGGHERECRELARTSR